ISDSGGRVRLSARPDPALFRRRRYVAIRFLLRWQVFFGVCRRGCYTIGSLQGGAQHSIPPHDGAGDEEDQRQKSKYGPEGFDRPSPEPSEMQSGQPSQNFVSRSRCIVRVIFDRLPTLNNVLKRGWKREVDARERPHQHQQKTPESGRAVEMPVK